VADELLNSSSPGIEKLGNDTVIVHEGEKLVLRTGKLTYTIRREGNSVKVERFLTDTTKLCDKVGCTIKVSIGFLDHIEVTRLEGGDMKVKWDGGIFGYHMQ
jgi:hypothetical protein